MKVHKHDFTSRRPILGLVFLIFNFLIFHSQVLSQPPTLIWQSALGGSGSDFANSIFQYGDGYLIGTVGRSNSDDGSFSNCGLSVLGDQASVTESDSSGNYIGCLTYGGSADDIFNCAMPVTPFGSAVHLVFLGRTLSNDYDVSGNHGQADAWLVRTQVNGQIIHQKCIGGTGWEDAFDFLEMPDKGFLICGVSSSDTIEGASTNIHGGFDGWLVRTDSIGNIIWSKMYGGSSEDFLYSICKTNDGNFVLGGFSRSNDGDVGFNNGSADYWVIKVDSAGNLLWSKTYGGSSMDYCFRVRETLDHSLVMIGYTVSYDSGFACTQNQIGNSQDWLVKLDSTGNLLLSHCYNADISFARNILVTEDSCFIVASYASSSTGDATGSGIHGCCDSWVYKVDGYGNIIWQKAFGSYGGDDSFRAIDKGTNGQYYLVGQVDQNSGDVTSFHGGDGDAWLIKIKDNALNVNIETPLRENNFQIGSLELSDLISTISEYPNSSFMVYDLLGRLELESSSSGTDLQFELTKISSGIHLIRFTIDQKTYTLKSFKLN